MQIVLVGIGGQGILFASRVLGHVALGDGLRVVGSEVHGMSQRGGSVVSHFKMGKYESPLVRVGEADALLAFDQREALRNYHFLRAGGVAVVNVDRPEEMRDPDLQEYFANREIRLIAVPGYELLETQLGGKFLLLNVLLLGAACGAALGIASDAARAAVGSLAPARFREDNFAAFDLGAEAVGKE